MGKHGRRSSSASRATQQNAIDTSELRMEEPHETVSEAESNTAKPLTRKRSFQAELKRRLSFSKDKPTTPAAAPDHELNILDEKGESKFIGALESVEASETKETWFTKLKRRISKGGLREHGKDEESQEPVLPPVPAPLSEDELSSAPSHEDIAERIRGAIDRLPGLPGQNQDDHDDKEHAPKVCEIVFDNDTGRPIPPPSSVPRELHDDELLSLIQCIPFMNGTFEESKSIAKPSATWFKSSPPPPQKHGVLSDLEGLLKLDWPSAISNGNLDLASSTVDASLYSNVQGGGVMLYAPFIPEEGDVVELARVQALHKHGFTDLLPSFPSLQLPWSQSATTALSTSTEAQPAVKWIPSTKKLSFEALWWGYRLYLPPPVVNILNDETLSIVKKAAMVTTALTWFFASIPITSLPLPLQPSLLILQQVVPYLSYIGTFITWSWGAIKGYDKGHGVILNATWLLPVALIPLTWKEEDWPKESSTTGLLAKLPKLLS